MWLAKEGVTYQFTRRIDRRCAVPAPISSSVSLCASFPRRRESSLFARRLPSPRFNHDHDSIEQLVITAKFVGANPNPEVIAEGQLEYKCNYFLGNDPSKWHTDVPNYEAITLKDIYPGIDLKYSGDGNGQAAYEFIAAPGADIAQIKVEYEGAEETSIDADGRMIVKTKWGDYDRGDKVSLKWSAVSGTAISRSCQRRRLDLKPLAQVDRRWDTFAVGLVYSTYLGGEVAIMDATSRSMAAAMPM